MTERKDRVDDFKDRESAAELGREPGKAATEALAENGGSGLEDRVARIQSELERLSRLVRGNGETGLLGQFIQLNERVVFLQSQWKWLVGLLAALVAAAVRQLVKGI